MRRENSRGILLDRGRVLLVRRPDSERSYAGHWQLPGGKLEPGESFADAAAREVREETGLSFSPAELFMEIEGRHFFLGEWSGELHLQPEEVCDARWCTSDEASRLLMSGTQRRVLRGLLERRLIG